MKCEKCGSMNESGAKFCSECGTNIEQVIVVKETNKKSNSAMIAVAVILSVFFIGLFSVIALTTVFTFNTIDNIVEKIDENPDAFNSIEDSINYYFSGEDDYLEYERILNKYYYDDVNWSRVNDMVYEYGTDLTPKIFENIIESSIVESYKTTTKMTKTTKKA